LSEQLQLRSGNATQVAAFTGAAAEVVVDTTNHRLVLQDGSTVGGFPAAKLAEVASLGVTAHAVSATIATGGIHKATATGITLTLPSPTGWAGGAITVKDRSGSSTPAIVIAGNVDGSAGGTSLVNPNQSLTLAADPVGATWLSI
jgi:hypothetical protein